MLPLAADGAASNEPGWCLLGAGPPGSAGRPQEKQNLQKQPGRGAALD